MERPRRPAAPLAVRPDWFVRSRLKLRQLLLLLRLGETRHLGRAAEDLSMTQPAATRLLRDLEAAFGAELFQRSRRGMAPTAQGEALLRHARILVNGLGRAREELEDIGGGIAGRLRIGTLISTAPVLLPRAIARLKARAPGLRISVQEGTNDLLVAALARGELDLMLGRVLPEPEGAGLAYTVLYEEPFVVVAGRAHALAGRRRIALASLVDEPWILPPPGTAVRQEMDGRFAREAGRQPGNVVESVSLLTNQTLLEEGGMLGLLPEAAARHYARNGLLKVLPVELDRLVGPVALITRAASAPTPAATEAIRVLTEVAATLQPR